MKIPSFMKGAQNLIFLSHQQLYQLPFYIKLSFNNLIPCCLKYYFACMLILFPQNLDFMLAPSLVGAFEYCKFCTLILFYLKKMIV